MSGRLGSFWLVNLGPWEIVIIWACLGPSVPVFVQLGPDFGNFGDTWACLEAIMVRLVAIFGDLDHHEAILDLLGPFRPRPRKQIENDIERNRLGTLFWTLKIAPKLQNVGSSSGA